MRLVRLLAIALATGCFVVTGELWSSALNPSPTIVFPTPVQPPPRLLPGDLSRQGPAAIVRLKPVPTYPIPVRTSGARTHGHAAARRGGAARHAGRVSAVQTRREQTPPAAPAAPAPAPAAAPAAAPPPKPAPGPKPTPQPPKSPGKPTPPSTPPPAPATPPTPTPTPTSPSPSPSPAPPAAAAAPPAQTPPPASTPPASTPPPAAATPPAATPEPPPQPAPTPEPSPDTRPGHGYGDKNHAHTGPPGQTGP